MPTQKKTTRRRAPQTPLRQTWTKTQKALDSAEATVEKRIRQLVERSGIDTRQASAALRDWRRRIEKEGRRARRELEGRLAALQARARKEQRKVSRTVDETVQRTLAALNIPTRDEIRELGRRVDLLSRKIDGFRR
jgi:polyhydroxyalkanoate synthesis regulator phasin